MTPDQKRELSIDEKVKFQIQEDSEAFEFLLEKVIEERCDEFDYFLEESGFEIIDRDFIRVATSIYNYKVIASK